jgi:ubiquinone/menaquinone biosynthesis C-methylase UbiE
MHHFSSAKSCCDAHSAKPRRFRRAAAALVVVAVGAAVSLHLLVIHVSYWWLPLVVVLVLAHAAIIGGIAWLMTRRRHNHQDASASHAGHEHGDHSHVLRNPRAYDWLARAVTLGGEGKFRRRTLDLAELHSGDAVLDVGCGTGTLLIEAATRVVPSGSMQGIDRSPEMLAHARRKAAAQGVTANFVEGSANRLPFPDASFDVVLCTLMLHHLPALMQMATIGEMRRVLRPGGRMVIVDLQPPKTVTAMISVIALFHVFHQARSRGNAPDWQKIEELLTQLGVQLVSRGEIWGGTVRALVGRIAPET